MVGFQVIFLWLLCSTTLIHGEPSSRQLERRIKALEKQGAEQGRLITSLLQRLDRQEEKLQFQSRTLQKQQLLIDRQKNQLQSQSQTLQKQQLHLDRQKEQLMFQSQTLQKQQLLFVRKEEQLMSQSQTLQKQQLLLERQEEELKSRSQTLDKQQLLLQQQAAGSDKLRSIVRIQGVRLKDQDRTLQTIRSVSQHQAAPALGKGRDENMARRFDSLVIDDRNVNSSQNPLTIQRGKTGAPHLMNKIKSERISSSRIEDEKARRLVGEQEGPVAFHAVIDKAEVAHIGINQNIVFDVVLENLGGAYHNQHGVFIAPANGVYIFSVSILSYVNPHPEFQAELKKDGVVLARIFGHGDNGREDQGSVTVVTNLAPGNEVWVSQSRITDDSIYGGRYTSFMGCLVYPL